MHSYIKFSFMMFPSLMVVVMLQTSDVNLSISPAHIDVGLSPFLDVNCTFSVNTSSIMADIISLTVSRENSSELASITDFSDHQVNVIPSEGITADGVINPGGQSHIHLHWDYPTDTQMGTYQCEASGLDLLGQTVIDSNTAMVTQDQADHVDSMDKIAELDKHIQDLDQKLLLSENYTKELEEKLVQNENYTKELKNYIKELEETLSRNDDCVKDVKQKVSDTSTVLPTPQTTVNSSVISSIFEEPYLTYAQKSYCVSKSPFTSFSGAINACKDVGGQLTEVNDLNEYHAIHDYLKASDFDTVYIGGTDEGHDGRWVLPSSGENLPVTDWWVNQPTSGELWNCLCLYSRHDWKMYSYFCHWDTENTLVRYMCEI